jgi:hypothetical protein
MNFGGVRSHVNKDFLKVNGALSSLDSVALNGGSD